MRAASAATRWYFEARRASADWIGSSFLRGNKLSADALLVQCAWPQSNQPVRRIGQVERCLDVVVGERKARRIECHRREFSAQQALPERRDSFRSPVRAEYDCGLCARESAPRPGIFARRRSRPFRVSENVQVSERHRLDELRAILRTSSSVSPGNPTITSAPIAASGISCRAFVTRSA